MTLKGAFTTGQAVVVSAYGHGSWEGKLPVGKGVIREEGDLAPSFPAEAFAALVSDRMPVPGNRVLLRAPNNPMLAACWFAVVKAGGIAVLFSASTFWPASSHR